MNIKLKESCNLSDKFKGEFTRFKKIIVITDDTHYKVTNYIDFLKKFLFVASEDIHIVEDFFVDYIKCVAAIKDIEVRIVKTLNENIMINTDNVKYLSLSNLQSIITCIVELNIAKIFIVY